MVKQAKSNIWGNKLLSTVTANLGRMVVLFVLLSFTATLSSANFEDVLIASFPPSSIIIPFASAVAIISAIGIESLVLVLHLNNRHNESLGILITLGICNFGKLYIAAFSKVTEWGLNEVVIFILIVMICAVLALGVYWLCIDISKDDQFKAICRKIITTEKILLATEEKEDSKVFEKTLLKLDEKKVRNEETYGAESYSKVVKELADLQRNLQ